MLCQAGQRASTLPVNPRLSGEESGGQKFRRQGPLATGGGKLQGFRKMPLQCVTRGMNWEIAGALLKGPGTQAMPDPGMEQAKNESGTTEMFSRP